MKWAIAVLAGLVAFLGVTVLLQDRAAFDAREEAAEALAKVVAYQERLSFAEHTLATAMTRHGELQQEAATERDARVAAERRYNLLRRDLTPVPPVVPGECDCDTLRVLIAERDSALDAGGAVAEGLRRENRVLAADTATLASAGRLAQRMLADTTNALEAARRSLMNTATGATEPRSWKRFLPSVWVGKEVIAYDFNRQKLEIASSRVSASVGWEIDF